MSTAAVIFYCCERPNIYIYMYLYITLPFYATTWAASYFYLIFCFLPHFIFVFVFWNVDVGSYCDSLTSLFVYFYKICCCTWTFATAATSCDLLCHTVATYVQMTSLALFSLLCYYIRCCCALLTFAACCAALSLALRLAFVAAVVEHFCWLAELKSFSARTSINKRKTNELVNGRRHNDCKRAQQRTIKQLRSKNACKQQSNIIT